jgi:23S rRNA pseudouridine2605 synthase
MEERIQKIMARAGLGSRRDCEVLIQAGRVRVNGVVAIIGGKADPSRDQITVDGNPLAKSESLVYVAMHKPRGVLSTVEAPDPRRTVRDLVPLPGTLYPVGRLDVDSEGLILLTNDGDLANRLTHPRYGHEKEYRVLVARQPDHQQIEAWLHGVVLEDGYRTAPARVYIESKFGRGAWLRVVLNEGRKRQIREMGMRTGLPVVRIIRVRFGSLELGILKAGDWRLLTPREVIDLKSPVAGNARRRVASRSGNFQKFQPDGQEPYEKRPTRQPVRGKPAGKPDSGAAKSYNKDRSGPTQPRRGPAGSGTPHTKPSSSDGKTPTTRRPPRRTPR